jgi:hypothetical protein
MTFWLTQIVLAYFKSPSDEPWGKSPAARLCPEALTPHAVSRRSNSARRGSPRKSSFPSVRTGSPKL